MSIQQFKDGSYITEYDTIKFHFHGLPFKIKTIEIDNEEVDFKSIKLNGNNSIEVSKDFTSLYISAK
jgi:alpha-glucosidase